MRGPDFIEWLIDHDACSEAMEWILNQHNPSPGAVWRTCPRGDWLMWWCEMSGAPRNTVHEVACRAVDRAVRIYAPDALDRAGFSELAQKLRALPKIVSTASARTAKKALSEIGDIVWEDAKCGDEVVAAESSVFEISCRNDVLGTAVIALVEAAEAKGSAWSEEFLCSANDCRELLTMPKMEG